MSAKSPVFSLAIFPASSHVDTTLPGLAHSWTHVSHNPSTFAYPPSARNAPSPIHYLANILVTLLFPTEAGTKATRICEALSWLPSHCKGHFPYVPKTLENYYH